MWSDSGRVDRNDATIRRARDVSARDRHVLADHKSLYRLDACLVVSPFAIDRCTYSHVMSGPVSRFGGAARSIIIVIPAELRAAILKVEVRLSDANSARDDEGEEGDQEGVVATAGD